MYMYQSVEELFGNLTKLTSYYEGKLKKWKNHEK